MTKQSEQTLSTNPNSALYWYPRIGDSSDELAASVPETEFVSYNFMESLGVLEGDVPDPLPWGEFVAAVEDVGYPAFIRTDQKSVKHAGPGAYKATEPDDIPTIVAVLTDHHVKANRHPAALMIREWVDVNAAFRAFDGLPIGRELRMFASPTEAECHHFYWPEEAIADGRGEPRAMDSEELLSSKEWRSDLDKLSDVPPDTLDALGDDAKAVAKSLNNKPEIPDDTVWSIDFAEDTDGMWWLIDAALAEDSWHPECDSDE